MRRYIHDCVCGALMAAISLATFGAWADVTLGPGETLTWATDAPAADETITATGGTIVFDADTQVTNNFYLGGEVAVTVNNDAMVRFTKTFYQTDPSGRLVMPRTFRFGSTDGNKFAFLPENAIAFAPGVQDAQLRLAGWTSMLALPDKWSNPIPYTYGTNVLVCFYGGNMVTDPVFTVPSNTTVRMTSPTNFPESTVIVVPDTATFQDRPAKFSFDTCAGTGVDNNTTTVRSNNLVLAGGTFQIQTGSTHHYWGNISGTGTINVGNQRPDKARNCYHYFYGDISGLDAQSQLTIDQYCSDTSDFNNGVRLNSDFPGTVKMNYNLGSGVNKQGETVYYNDVVSFGFNNPNTSGATNENWSVGALQGGAVIGPRNGEGGARLQYSALQHIHVGRLSGKFAIVATAVSNKLNTNDLFADTVADDTVIYVKNGIRLHFGTVGKGVKIRYMADQLSSNVVEVASGTIEEITFLANLRSKPVYLHGNVGFVGGPGKVIASDGSRVGFVGAEAEVVVNSGSVALGDEELFGSKPALWVDASDLSTYAPLYKSSYHNNGTLHAPSTLLGADKPANVFTNDFPLVEKWYDKRPEQRLNFFWNDRWKYDDGTFYPQFYPYIVPNGLNGKPILSFGIHREAGSNGLSSEWTHVGSPGSANGSENRRMHLMQNPPTGVVAEGHAVYVHSCVMVFGSERGGGRCILGGYKGNAGTAIDGTHNPQCGDHFLRTGSGYGVENGIFQAKIDGGKTNVYETWVNGTSVICTNTPMSGSWDVISFQTDKAGDGGRAFRNIGCPADVNQSGGQDYAEFLVYSNKLTTAERLIVENYLASKWGLTGKQAANAGTITLGAGGTLVGSLPNIAGSGTWTLGANDYAVLDGSFTGTIGGTGNLTVPGGNLSFTHANGAFAPALVAPDANLTFAAAPTVTVTTTSALLPGDYPLVQGKTLTGLTDCTLSHNIGGGMKVKLVRTDTSLILRALPGGITVIFR